MTSKEAMQLVNDGLELYQLAARSDAMAEAAMLRGEAKTSAEKASAVLADPDARWAVLSAGLKVAGPWERRDDSAYQSSYRYDARGKAAGSATRYGDRWHADAPWRRAEFYTRAKAEAWVDEVLRERGWVLAGSEVADDK